MRRLTGWQPAGVVSGQPTVKDTSNKSRRGFVRGPADKSQPLVWQQKLGGELGLRRDGDSARDSCGRLFVDETLAGPLKTED